MLEIKAKIMMLGKKQKDLLPVLRDKYGMTVSPTELSDAMSGARVSTKYQDIVDRVIQIVADWEDDKTK